MPSGLGLLLLVQDYKLTHHGPSYFSTFDCPFMSQSQATMNLGQPTVLLALFVIPERWLLASGITVIPVGKLNVIWQPSHQRLPLALRKSFGHSESHFFLLAPSPWSPHSGS